MIQPNELRIGNWVNGTSDFKKYPMPLKVQAITNSRVYYHINNEINELEFDKYGECNLQCNDVYPVELTPDILEAAGFKRLQNRNRYSKDELTNDIVFSNGFYISNVTPEIKYLHQLQNLYFALTGDELQIDITKLNK